MDSIVSVKSIEARNVCYLSGISLSHIRGVKINLEDSIRTLEVALREAETAQIEEKQWRYAEIGARALKGACDVAIEIMGGYTGVAGKVVSTGYDGAGLMISAINGDLTPSSFSLTMAGKHFDIGKDASEYAGHEKLAEVFGSLKLLLVAGGAVYDTVSAYKDGVNGGSGITAATRTLIKQLQTARLRLRDVNLALKDCE